VFDNLQYRPAIGRWPELDLFARQPRHFVEQPTLCHLEMRKQALSFQIGDWTGVRHLRHQQATRRDD